MAEPQYEVVSPVGRWVGGSRRPAPAGSVDVRRVGFIWDYVFRGDEMFRMAREALRARDSALTFVGHEVFGDIHGPDERRVVAELPARLQAQQVDAVIVGVGA
jgi:hypothetical protein